MYFKQPVFGPYTVCDCYIISYGIPFSIKVFVFIFISLYQQTISYFKNRYQDLGCRDIF